MIEPAVNTNKNCGRSLLYHIRLYDKITSLDLPDICPAQTILAIFYLFLFRIGQMRRKLFSQVGNICFSITGLVWHFKSASEINKFQIRENVRLILNITSRPSRKHPDIFYLTSRMHMNACSRSG